MGKGNPKQPPSQNESSMNLKGTLISVMLLGIFVLIAWFGLYALFLSR